METALEKNRKYSNRYIQKNINMKIPFELEKTLIQNKINSFIDLGCGEGGMIRAIKKKFPSTKICGIDISPRRISSLKKDFPQEEFYIADVCNTKIKKKFDFVFSSMVIEHVSNDKKLVDEMVRISKPGGFIFCSSVIKKPFAIYIYRNKGKFVLDPTHEREYKDEKEFLDLFREKFKLIYWKKLPIIKSLFGIKFKLLGYYSIEGIWRKK